MADYITKLREAGEKATAGPWFARIDYGSLVVRPERASEPTVAFWLDRTSVTPNAAFIALARNAWPELVEVVACAQALRDESPWFYGDLQKALDKLKASVGEGG